MSYLFSPRIISLIEIIPGLTYSNTYEGKLAILRASAAGETDSKGGLIVRKGDDDFTLGCDFYILADSGPKGVYITPYESRVRWFFTVDEPNKKHRGINDHYFVASRGQHRVYGWLPPEETARPDEIIFEDIYEWDNNLEWYMPPETKK